MNILNVSSSSTTQNMWSSKLPKAADVVQFMDQDQNGTLSKTEVQGPLAERFDTADTNNDGQMSTEELNTLMEGLHQQMKAKMGQVGTDQFQMPTSTDLMSGMDQDSNGSISASEATGMLAQRFDIADTNQDGEVSLDELEQDMANIEAENQAAIKTKSSSDSEKKSFQLPTSDELISGMDQDSNGSISASEATGKLAERFDIADANQDGEVSQDELEQDMANIEAENQAALNSLTSSSSDKSNALKLSLYNQIMNYNSSSSNDSISPFIQMIA